MSHMPARRNPPATQGGRSRIVAAILAFFVGGFGIHRVYLGQYWRALLFFVFSVTFIPSFFGIVDAIRYLAMGEEEFDRRYNPDLYHRRLADEAAYARLMNNGSVDAPNPHAGDIRSPRSAWKGGGSGAWSAYQPSSSIDRRHAFDPSTPPMRERSPRPAPATWEPEGSAFSAGIDAVRGRLVRAFDAHAEMQHLHEELLAGRITEHEYLARRERAMQRQ